ncbi:hypothetical protein ACFQY4_02435 [Catellatospora bangladeshensis]|uniref:hypothetical protein n=1 Tax=Catellatospora bangladeshensis TaxID=310355 RepID=UPI00360D0990
MVHEGRLPGPDRRHGRQDRPRRGPGGHRGAGRYSFRFIFTLIDYNNQPISGVAAKTVTVTGIATEGGQPMITREVDMSGLLYCNTQIRLTIVTYTGGPSIPTKVYSAPIIQNANCIIG